MGEGLLSQNVGIGGAVFPVDINGAGADGDWISLENHDRASLVVLVGAQSGATTMTVEEASDVSGTGATAIAFSYRVTPTNSDQFGALTAATTSGVATDGSTANVIYEIEVRANQLTSGKPFIRLRFSNPGAACLVSCSHLGYGTRYKRETMPTMLA